MKVVCKNLNDTKKLAAIFCKNLDDGGCFVSLTGDIGAGKTAFTRFVLKEMGVKEKVTSPSFVILNEYHGYRLPIYHFDLYRLEHEGLKTIAEELSSYSKQKVLTFVEWADFGSKLLSIERLNIKISYPKVINYSPEGDERIFEFEAMGENNEMFAKKIVEEYKAGA